MDDTGKKMNFMELLKATLTSAMEEKARELEEKKYKDEAMSAAYKAAQKHNGGFLGGRVKEVGKEKISVADFMTEKGKIDKKYRANAELDKDPVCSPSHYTFSQYEVIDVLQAWFPNNPLLWQVGKYIARAEHKGNALQDLQKARWYLQREIDRLERIKAHG